MSTHRDALIALAEAHQGRLTPEMVVEAARDPDSPLHRAFTWDDAKAAEQHRLAQARALIRTVRVQVSDPMPLASPPPRMFVRDPTLPPDRQGYLTLPRLRSQEDVARAAVVAALQRVSEAVAEARSLALALDVDEALAEIGERIGSLVKRPDIGGADARAPQ